MENNRDRYYRMKVQEIEKAQHKKSDQEATKMFIYIAAVGMALLLVLVLLSPGVLFATYISLLLEKGMPVWAAWVTAIAFTGTVVGLFHLAVKKKKNLTIAFYVAIICGSSAALYYFQSPHGHFSMIHTVLYMFTPLDEPSGEVKPAAVEPEESPVQETTPVVEEQVALPALPSEETERGLEVGDVLEENKPSFNCDLANRPVERLICSDKRLADLDNQLSALYATVATQTDPVVLKVEQLAWIKYRDTCVDTNCVAVAYQNRINKLEAYMPAKGLLRPDNQTQ